MGGIKDLFTDDNKPNILLIITDQERSLQHWPDNFASEHLPALTRLMKNGMSFTQAFTGACLCSPSRATFLTSRYPSETGVTTTGSPQPRVPLPKDIANLATVLQSAGYTCAWKGKWHLGAHPKDYGFTGWDPPDAGTCLSINNTLGGGKPDNDGRFLKDCIDFLDNAPKPFCLVASFVNPHDVYMAQYDPTLGYTHEDFNKVKVPTPSNWDEDLETKPRAHEHMSMLHVPFDNTVQDYVNFYAYLHTVVDAQILKLLEKLDSSNLTDNTLTIRFSDHGEQALSHGLVEKFFNAYEESIRIPLIFSNPRVWSQPEASDSLVSALDLVPTLAELLGVTSNFSKCFRGQNLCPILENSRGSVQDTVVSCSHCRLTIMIVDFALNITYSILFILFIL